MVYAYRLKSSFICNFWSWSNVYSGDKDKSFAGFSNLDGV